MTIRIIKSENCPICKSYVSRLQAQNFSFVTYDGDSKDNSDQLDKWNVNSFPVVQIVDNGNVVYQYQNEATPSPDALNRKIKQLKGE
jgi:glutaredoxin